MQEKASKILEKLAGDDGGVGLCEYDDDVDCAHDDWCWDTTNKSSRIEVSEGGKKCHLPSGSSFHSIIGNKVD